MPESGVVGDSVVRLLDLNTEGGFGSGVLLTPDTILTARHVIDPTGSGGETVGVDALRVETAAYRGRFNVARVTLPPSSDIDLALVHLLPDLALEPQYCCPIRKQPQAAFSIGDEVDVIGFSSIDGGVERDRVRVLSVHPAAGAFICNRALARGYSGGPVLVDGGLVGVIYARDHKQGQTYFYGIGQLTDFLNHAHVDVHWMEHDLSSLRRYPLGPGIGATEIYMQIGAVIEAFLELFPGEQAVITISKANRAREQCGPDSGKKGWIELQYLPHPDKYPAGFWYGAFVQAGQKSPRMVAALLEAVNSELLKPEARAEKAAFLARITSPPH